MMYYKPTPLLSSYRHRTLTFVYQLTTHYKPPPCSDLMYVDGPWAYNTVLFWGGGGGGGTKENGGTNKTLVGRGGVWGVGGGGGHREHVAVSQSLRK